MPCTERSRGGLCIYGLSNPGKKKGLFSMDVREAILTRRSLGRVKPDPVDRKEIEALLSAAVWAPTHYHREPWRFYVMTGEGRKVLGQAYADIALAQAEGLTAERRETIREQQYAKAFRSPVVIAVAAELTGKSEIDDREDRGAVYAAVQNMLLAAHDLGLAAMWRTGAPAYDPHMKEAIGLKPSEELVAFVYVGHPDPAFRPEGKRVPYQEKTVWID